MSAPKRSLLDRLRRWAWIVAINLAIVVGLLYLNQRRYLRRLPKDHGTLAQLAESRGLPLAVQHGLQPLMMDAARRDFRLLPKKRPGWLRIGAFGDSFTWGDEVTAPLCYPTQLAELFRRDGFTNVEVESIRHHVFPGMHRYAELRQRGVAIHDAKVEISEQDVRDVLGVEAWRKQGGLTDYVIIAAQKA